MYADAYVSLDAYARGETADTSDPHHPRSPHSSGAHGTSSAAKVQQGEHRGQSAGDEGGVSSIPAEAGETKAERAFGERVLNYGVISMIDRFVSVVIFANFTIETASQRDSEV